MKLTNDLRATTCALLATAGLLAFGASASATLTVTPTTDEVALANALLTANTGGLDNVTVALVGHTANGAASSGTYQLAKKLPSTYGLRTGGIVLSTGNVADYSTGKNTDAGNNTSYGVVATGPQQALLGPISGALTHYDATTLAFTFDVPPGVTNLSVSFVFGSEEFPEGILSEKDGFGIYLNGVNLALVNSAVVTSRHASMAAVSGTELDGVLAPNGNPLVTLVFPVAAGSTGNTLTFIIGDSNDDLTDSTVYLTALGVPNGVASGIDLAGEWDTVTPKCKTKKEVTKCKVKGRLLISNTGVDPAPSVFVSFYLSDDNVLDETDEFLRQVASGTVKPGKPKKKTVSASILGEVTGRYLIAVIDADDAVAETNEDNNVIVFGPLP